MAELDLVIRPAKSAEAPLLETIRAAAFSPVFAAFRSALGDELYALTQARDDEAQGELLASILRPGQGWEALAAEVGGAVVGFVSLRLDPRTRVGEIGLNAVHPDCAGKGVGTALYRRALTRMKEEGMQAATVGVGGDPSHAAARRAYEKAGFTAGIPSLWLARAL